jgi:hypothetical protein
MTQKGSWRSEGTNTGFPRKDARFIGAANRGGRTWEATESPPIASRASGSTLGSPDPPRWVGKIVASILVALKQSMVVLLADWRCRVDVDNEAI